MRIYYKVLESIKTLTFSNLIFISPTRMSSSVNFVISGCFLAEERVTMKNARTEHKLFDSYMRNHDFLFS